MALSGGANRIDDVATAVVVSLPASAYILLREPH